MDCAVNFKAIARKTRVSDMRRLGAKGRCRMKEEARECAATCRLDVVARVCGIWQKGTENEKRMYLSQVAGPSLWSFL